MYVTVFQGSLQDNFISYITLLVNYAIKGIDKIVPKHGIKLGVAFGALFLFHLTTGDDSH